jgi:hypothetical protein
MASPIPEKCYMQNADADTRLLDYFKRLGAILKSMVWDHESCSDFVIFAIAGVVNSVLVSLSTAVRIVSQRSTKLAAVTSVDIVVALLKARAATHCQSAR